MGEGWFVACATNTPTVANVSRPRDTAECRAEKDVQKHSTIQYCRYERYATPKTGRIATRSKLIRK